MKVVHHLWIGAGLILTSATAIAVPGNLDYNTFGHRAYQNSWQATFAPVQWVNQDDWKDEMDGVADCYQCKKNPASLNTEIITNKATGLNADLILVQTHGDQTGVGATFTGRLCSWTDQELVNIKDFDSYDDEVEIHILWACTILAMSNGSNWYGYRNMHRNGALVTTGCHGLCYLADVGINTTFNELGDEIADSESKIWFSWKEAHTVGWDDDNPMIIGLGRVGANNCGSRASNVSLQNRLDYTNYTYSYDYPKGTGANDYEFCGYYESNW